MRASADRMKSKKDRNGLQAMLKAPNNQKKRKHAKQQMREAKRGGVRSRGTRYEGSRTFI